MVFLHKAVVRETRILQNVLLVIRIIENQLIQSPSLTSLIITISGTLNILLIIVKTLNFGGIKSRLLLDDVYSYIEIELPSINDPRVYNEGYFLKQILDYREYIINHIVSLIMNELKYKLHDQPNIKVADIDIYTATGSTDPQCWHLVVEAINNIGMNAILIDGMIHFDRCILES